MSEMPIPGPAPEQSRAPVPEVRDRPAATREIEEKYLLSSEQDFNNLDARLRAMGSYLAYAAYETSYIYPSVDVDTVRALAPNLNETAREQLAAIPDGVQVSMTVKEKKNREDGRWASLTIKAGGDPLHDQSRIEVDVPVAGHHALDLVSELGLPRPDTIWQAEPRRRFQLDTRWYGPNTYVDLMLGTGYGPSAEIEADSPETIAEIEAALGGLRSMTGDQKRAGYQVYQESDFSRETTQRDAGELVFDEAQWDRIGQLAGSDPVRNRVEAPPLTVND
jgi:hypothetical protein